MNVEQRINQLGKRMTQVESQFDEMNRTLRRIESAMTGDQQYGVMGIPEKVSKNTSNIEALEDFKRKVTYYALGGSTVGSALGWIIITTVLNHL